MIKEIHIFVKAGLTENLLRLALVNYSEQLVFHYELDKLQALESIFDVGVNCSYVVDDSLLLDEAAWNLCLESKLSPIILLSSASSSSAIASQSVKKILRKPFQPLELVTMIREA